MIDEEVIDKLILRLKEERLLSPERDYTVSDIIKMTGYSRSKITVKLHGEYYIGGKRLFRKEIIDYRRKMGLNLAIEKAGK